MGNNTSQPIETFESHVSTHGPLFQLAPNLWIVYGAIFGTGYKNMVVYRMKNGKGLWLWSTIALVEPEMKKIGELGKVTFINVPNGQHRIDCAVYKTRYPDAKVICPVSARAKVEQKVKVDVTDEEPGIFADTGIKLVKTVGVKAENIYELDISEGEAINENGDKALISCDLIFNHMPKPTRGGSLSPINRAFRWYIFSDYMGFAADMVKKIDAYGDSLKVVCVAHDYHLVVNGDQKPGQLLKSLFTSRSASTPVPSLPPYVEIAYKPLPESVKTK